MAGESQTREHLTPGVVRGVRMARPRCHTRSPRSYPDATRHRVVGSALVDASGHVVAVVEFTVSHMDPRPVGHAIMTRAFEPYLAFGERGGECVEPLFAALTDPAGAVRLAAMRAFAGVRPDLGDACRLLEGVAFGLAETHWWERDRKPVEPATVLSELVPEGAAPDSGSAEVRELLLRALARDDELGRLAAGAWRTMFERGRRGG